MNYIEIIRDIISPLLSVILALAGVIIGGRMARKTDEKHHRTQLLIKAYQDFIASVTLPGAPDTQLQFRAVYALRVLCSPETEKIAIDLCNERNKPRPDPVVLAQLTDALVAAARKDIDYSPTTKRPKTRKVPKINS